MTVATHLAEWSTALRLAEVPPPVQQAACRHLLDGVGTAMAAFRLAAAAPAVTVATGLAGPPEATILGSATRIVAPAAALANGTLVHALDLDDTHAGGLVHPTAAVLPAAFAVGQKVGASGAQVLEACLAGDEVVCRLAAATPHAFHARGLHASSVCGVFAAATVAAKLTGMAQPQTVDALGIAGSQAGGLLEFLHTGASTKQLHLGLAAHAGILAARLAAAGATGPDSVLEGGYGLYGALAGRDVDPQAILAGLGERWEVTRITVKSYPACQLVHAALDAARQLRDLIEAVDEVERVVVDVPADVEPIVCEPRASKLRPRSPYDAKFSLPWSVAALMVDGEVGVSTYSSDSVGRREVSALAERIGHRVVPFDGAAADAPGRLEVRLRDGRSVVAEVPRSAGGPDNPLDLTTLTAKAVTNMGGTNPAKKLAAGVLELAAQPSLEPLFALACQIAQGGSSW